MGKIINPRRETSAVASSSRPIYQKLLSTVLEDEPFMYCCSWGTLLVDAEESRLGKKGSAGAPYNVIFTLKCPQSLSSVFLINPREKFPVLGFWSHLQK